MLETLQHSALNAQGASPSASRDSCVSIMPKWMTLAKPTK